MASNKRQLQQDKKHLTKAKAPSTPKDILYTPLGQYEFPGEVTKVPTPTGSITMAGVSTPLYGVDNTGFAQMMYPENEYQFPGDVVTEYPQEAKRGGTAYKLTKPSKKGINSKAYSRSLMATNRLFLKNPLFKKPKSKRNKIFDPKAKYYEDGGEQDAMNAMMKARLAYANEFGNPAAQRMINLPDNPYQFDDGNTGTHYMASMDNYAVPQIQDINGQLMLGDYGPESNEAIQFDRPEDAEYFAEHYKEVSPGFIEAELTDDEIEEYRKGGYIVEDISVPSLNNYQDGGEIIVDDLTDDQLREYVDGGYIIEKIH
jgi:hypothetical protein